MRKRHPDQRSFWDDEAPQPTAATVDAETAPPQEPEGIGWRVPPRDELFPVRPREAGFFRETPVGRRRYRDVL